MDPSQPTAAQRELDAIQIRLLGAEPTPRQVAEYANACLNSALGLVRTIGGDVAVRFLLLEWLATVEGRIEADT